MTSMKRPLNVLVLDDDDTILQLLKIFLRQLGYRVSTAHNGREGIQMMLETRFDLIIIDVQMPMINGFEMAEEILRLWPWEKIIICTGHLNRTVQQKADGLGIRSILEKPISFNKLEMAISKLSESLPMQKTVPSTKNDYAIYHGLEFLRKFNQEVTVHQDFGRMIQEYAEVIHRIIPCVAAGVFGMEGNYNRLCIYSDKPIESGFLGQLTTEIRSHLEFFSGTPLLDLPTAEQKILHPRAGGIEATNHSLMMNPVPRQRDARGMVFIVLEGKNSSSPELLNNLIFCSHHLSTMLGFLETTQAHSIRDPLTGLYSKAYIQEQIQTAWKFGSHPKKTIGLLSIDLNDFKSINLSHGFEAGDEVLKKIADVIETELQETESAGRLGGDEFWVFMPDTEAARAQLLSKSLVSTIEKLSLVFNGEPIKLSVSMGVALTEDEHGITSSSQLVECADNARFVAKQSEGISISSWTELRESGEASYHLHPILVVDDDPQIVSLIKRLLNKNMYEVTGVGSVAEAVSLLNQGNRYELILTDLALPHQDGTEMIRLGQEIDSDMVSVVISGNLSKESEQQLLQRGAFGVIKKPFGPEQLRSIVTKSVEYRTRTARKSG